MKWVASSRAEVETCIGILADRLGIGYPEAQVVLGQLQLAPLLRAVPESDLRRLAGVPARLDP